MVILKSSLRNHLQIWKFHLVGSILMLLPLCIVQFWEYFVLSFCVCWSIFTLPALFLYFEYLYLNISVEVEVNKDGLVYKRGKDVYTFKKEQIQSIKLYMVPNKYLNSNMKL